MAIFKNELDALATVADLQRLENNIPNLMRKVLLELDAERKHALQSFYRPKFLTPKQFAEQFAEKPGGRRVHPETIRNWCKDGRLKAVQQGGLGSSWLIPFAELERIYNIADAMEPVILIK